MILFRQLSKSFQFLPHLFNLQLNEMETTFRLFLRQIQFLSHLKCRFPPPPKCSPLKQTKAKKEIFISLTAALYCLKMIFHYSKLLQIANDDVMRMIRGQSHRDWLEEKATEIANFFWTHVLTYWTNIKVKKYFLSYKKLQLKQTFINKFEIIL